MENENKELEQLQDLCKYLDSVCTSLSQSMIELITQCDVGVPKSLYELVSFVKNNQNESIHNLCKFVNEIPKTYKANKKLCSNCT